LTTCSQNKGLFNKVLAIFTFWILLLGCPFSSNGFVSFLSDRDKIKTGKKAATSLPVADAICCYTAYDASRISFSSELFSCCFDTS